MKIYTKTGDKGSTSLVGGTRTQKSDLRVWTYGTIDEVNSALGVARSNIKDREVKDIVLNIQKTLFEVGAELSSIGTDNYKIRLSENDVQNLEKIIDKMSDFKPLQNGFMVPGGTIESGYLDVARSDTRRAERYLVELSNKYEISDVTLKYINRLSDTLYALARYMDYKDIIEKSKNKIEHMIENNQKQPILGGDVHSMNRKIARYIVDRCIEKAYEIKVPMVICVMDAGGNIVVLERMDDSLLASLKIAVAKAYSAVSLKMSTDELHNLSLPDGELYGINTIDNVVSFGGGFPLEVNGKIIGSVGVSGGTVKEDMSVSKHGLDAFKEVFDNGYK